MRDGRRLWPALYTARGARPVTTRRSSSALKVRQLRGPMRRLRTGRSRRKRDWVFAEGCRRIGATAVPLKVADDGDANEGWWNEGQRFERAAEPDARTTCATRRRRARAETGCEVETVAPIAGGGYVVRGTDHRTGQRARARVPRAGGGVRRGRARARCCCVARRVRRGRPLDPSGLLGRRLSANGDYGVTGTSAPSSASTSRASRASRCRASARASTGSTGSS